MDASDEPLDDVPDELPLDPPLVDAGLPPPDPLPEVPLLGPLVEPLPPALEPLPVRESVDEASCGEDWTAGSDPTHAPTNGTTVRPIRRGRHRTLVFIVAGLIHQGCDVKRLNAPARARLGPGSVAVGQAVTVCRHVADACRRPGRRFRPGERAPPRLRQRRALSAGEGSVRASTNVAMSAAISSTFSSSAKCPVSNK